MWENAIVYRKYALNILAWQIKLTLKLFQKNQVFFMLYMFLKDFFQT